MLCSGTWCGIYFRCFLTGIIVDILQEYIPKCPYIILYVQRNKILTWGRQKTEHLLYYYQNEWIGYQNKLNVPSYYPVTPFAVCSIPRNAGKMTCERWSLVHQNYGHSLLLRGMMARISMCPTSLLYHSFQYLTAQAVKQDFLQ